MSCSHCRGRFNLPSFHSGRCEVCHTLQRLTRVILTRHPPAEVATLVKLLTRTADKVEAFVEEWELNQALGASVGGSAADPPESNLPGLTPVAKSSSARPRRESGELPENRERRKEASREPGTVPEKASEHRSRSKKEKKDRSRKRHGRRRSKDRSRDRTRRDKKSEPVEAVAVKEEEEKDLAVSKAAVEDTDESPIRDDRRSPSRRKDDVVPSPPRRDTRVPRSPTRSPPGYTRGVEPEWQERSPIRRDKPKKDKGYNHYIRGKEFREKYGFDRGRGRGAWSW